MEAIAADMIDSGVDIMIGGGKAYFDRRESDDRYLSDELAAKGYKLSNFIKQDISKVDVKQMGDKWMYYTADKEPLSVQAGRDYLIPASEIAINFLSDQSKDKENGFFVMIEGSQIDWAGHANNFPYMVSELLEFDEVIKYALDFAEKDKNTLVIVTADHETGGLAIASGSKMNEVTPAYTSDYHTATMIPVFAYGPGAELFSGIYENTDIYHKMKQALGLSVK
jgi:alkaline phosphatase